MFMSGPRSLSSVEVSAIKVESKQRSEIVKFDKLAIAMSDCAKFNNFFVWATRNTMANEKLFGDLEETFEVRQLGAMIYDFYFDKRSTHNDCLVSSVLFYDLLRYYCLLR